MTSKTKRFMRTVGFAGTATLLATLIGSSAAWAGTATTSTSAGQATFTFPDVVLDGSGLCFEAPISATATVVPNTDWFVDVQFRLPGTAPLSSTGRVSGTNSGSATGQIQICPTDGVGKMIVEGEFTTFLNDPPYTNATTRFTSEVMITKAPTTTAISRIKLSVSSASISGKVMAESSQYGSVATSGDVKAEFRTPGSKKWVAMGKGYTSNSGFSVSVNKKLPKGTSFRATFLGNDHALGSSATK